MIPAEAFPRLTPYNHRVTSPPSIDYNCIAWSAGDMDHWWQPGLFWPIEVQLTDCGIAVLQQMFKARGYEDGGKDTSFETGFEKVALFSDGLYDTRAARQLANGKWTSKLGKAEDIEHDTPDDVAGGLYGDFIQVMKRSKSG
jgi:hypothetical protein